MPKGGNGKGHCSSKLSVKYSGEANAAQLQMLQLRFEVHQQKCVGRFMPGIAGGVIDEEQDTLTEPCVGKLRILSYCVSNGFQKFHLL